MVAANGRIGGFSGQWGEGEKIQKKIRLLKSEGVVFDSTGKIDEKYILKSVPSSSSKKDNNKLSTPTHSAKKIKKEKKTLKASSEYSPTNQELRSATLLLVAERAAGKTC